VGLDFQEVYLSSAQVDLDVGEVYSSFAQVDLDSEEAHSSSAQVHLGVEEVHSSSEQVRMRYAEDRPLWRESFGVFEGLARLGVTWRWPNIEGRCRQTRGQI
jgi:hypothetical protein